MRPRAHRDGARYFLGQEIAVGAGNTADRDGFLSSLISNISHFLYFSCFLIFEETVDLKETLQIVNFLHSLFYR